MTDELRLTPFCVADRPMSLRILRGIDLARYSGNVGIMIHANTSKEFQALTKEYPLENGVCPFHKRRHGREQCERVRTIRARTVKMCDSGVFTKNGALMNYSQLFDVYERSGVAYGIIIDHLRKADATVESAREAMKAYQERYGGRDKGPFQLVGVAQGRNVKDYLRCYATLRALGYKHIAVGGLLNRRKNTARYVYVKGGRLFHILEALRDQYPRDWMFALGCYHPRRHDDFERYAIAGSDYKGWIFNYEPRNELGTTKARKSRFRQVRAFLQRHVYSDAREPLDFRDRKKKKQSNDLAVVACSKGKIWDVENRGGTLARFSYRGTLFRLSSEFADRHAERWVILSGKHGFLNPDSRVPGPYDARLPPKLKHDEAVRFRKQVIAKGLHRYRRVVVFGGEDYTRAVRTAFLPFGVKVVPAFAPSMRIGARLRHLKQSKSLPQLISRD